VKANFFHRGHFLKNKTLFLFFMAAAFAINASAAPQALLLVLNKGDETLALVDPVSEKVVALAPAGKNPHEVTATSDGRLAFISNYGNGHTLSVVDLVAQKALAPVELGALLSPHGLAEAQGKIYFTAEGSRAIGRCDPSTRKIDWIMGLGQERTHMIAVTRDAKKIFTSNVNSDSISVIEEKSGGGLGGGPGSGINRWNITNIPVGKGPEGFDVSPDEKELWAANSHDGTVSIIDLATKTVEQTLTVGTRMSNRIKFTPDGKLVLISDISGRDLVVLDAAARKVIKRIDVGGGSARILIEPGGARAYVSVGSANGVVIIDLKSLEIAGRIPTGKGPDGLAWAVEN
jgi:YVTN family beta-propeller protein